MIYTLIVFVILLTFTIEPKYLGKLKLLSLRNITSKTNVQTIRHGLLIAFLLWLVYYLFHKELKSFFQTKESMTGIMSLDSDLQLSKIKDNIVYSNFEKFTFNNTNKKLSDSSDLKLTDKFTVMAWVKQKEKSNDWVRVIGKGDATHRNYGLWIENNNRLLSQIYPLSKGRNVWPLGKAIESNTWTHLAMTFHKDHKHKLYKDGELMKEEDTSGTPLTDDEPLTIGGAEFHDKFKGEITGAIVLNRVLHKEEIKKFAESPDKNLNEILGLGDLSNISSIEQNNFTKINVGSSTTSPKVVPLPNNVTYVDNTPYNEQNPVWNDRFITSIDTANKTLSVYRTDTNGSGWGQNLVLKGYKKKYDAETTKPATKKESSNEKFINIDGGFPYPDGGYSKNKDNRRYTRGWALSNGFKGSKDDCEKLCNSQPECINGICKSKLFESDERCYCKFSPTSLQSSKLTIPELTKPEPTIPELTKPEPTMTEFVKPATTEPTIPELTMTEFVKPATTEPTMTEPTMTESVKPATTEPTITEPVKPATTEPTKPTTTELTKPTTTEPTKPATTEPTKPATTEPTKTTFPKSDKQQVPEPAPAPAPGTFGSGTASVPPEDELLKTQAASGPNYETSHGSMINHPELTKGLTTDKVTPKPVYYEPGTVKYSGLGYVPSYSEMIYLNNYPFESKPKELHDGNPHGFCSTKDNTLNNIEEKCNGLPTNVCSTTDCCVLVGGTHCVEGDEKGPKNKVIYSDTNIKNRDVYYYKGDCYGNCK